jgi:hypothetical protein
MCHDRALCVVSLEIWPARARELGAANGTALTWGEQDHTRISAVIASPWSWGANLWGSAADDNSGQQKGTS